MTEELSINLCQIPDICNVDTTTKTSNLTDKKKGMCSRRTVGM